MLPLFTLTLKECTLFLRLASFRKSLCPGDDDDDDDDGGDDGGGDDDNDCDDDDDDDDDGDDDDFRKSIEIFKFRKSINVKGCPSD